MSDVFLIRKRRDRCGGSIVAVKKPTLLDTTIKVRTALLFATQFECSNAWSSKKVLTAMDKIADDRDLGEILKDHSDKPDKIKP